ncbi:MAG: hypothetical protein V4638_06430 [Bacteroidota bacterium]
MKKLILSISIVCSLLSTTVLYSQNSVEEINLTRYLTLESYLFKIPVEKNVLVTEIMPQIEHKKQELAVHFPEKSTIEGPYISQEVKESLIQNWFTNYPGEFHNYISYLEELIRSYH